MSPHPSIVSLKMKNRPPPPLLPPPPSAGGGSQGGLKAAVQEQMAVSAQDSMMQAKEREEMSELQDEVKKLREKAQVQILVFF